MNQEIKKMIAVPLDGSSDSLRSINYLNLIFGSSHNLDISLLYIMPCLPPFLVDNCMSNVEAARELKAIKKENAETGKKILEKGKKRFIEQGYNPDNIQQVCQKEELGTHADICRWSEKHQVDAIMLHTRGLTRLEGFFMGEITIKLLECCNTCPVWVMKGGVKSDKILLPVDASEKSLRAVDHAGFMLAGTDKKIILFHSKQELSRFVPKSLLNSIPSIKALWAEKSTEAIEPYLEQAKNTLLTAGINEKNISVEIIQGTGKPDKDILKQAQKKQCSTIIVGREGMTANKQCSMGGTARKVLEGASNVTVWIV